MTRGRTADKLAQAHMPAQARSNKAHDSVQQAAAGKLQASTLPPAAPAANCKHAYHMQCSQCAPILTVHCALNTSESACTHTLLACKKASSRHAPWLGMRCEFKGTMTAASRRPGAARLPAAARPRHRQPPHEARGERASPSRRGAAPTRSRPGTDTPARPAA